MGGAGSTAGAGGGAGVGVGWTSSSSLSDFVFQSNDAAGILLCSILLGVLQGLW